MEKALAVFYDHTPVCLVCAEKHAIESGAPSLYWAINRPRQIDGTIKCECGHAMLSDGSLAASERIADLMEKP